ncbi:MAG: PIN domain-containing protein, partial [Tetrasphaera sp.]|nr:PIN domain-containing protein [Tetrasphaera sp.]
RRRILSERFEGEVMPLFHGRILAFDELAATAYARIRARARQRGRALGDFDALIAAIADANGLTVASRDTGPFVVAGVPVINPFTP